MKRLFLLSFIFLSITSSAQNVGIGTTTPNQRLDVNGRMRLRHLPNTTPGIWLNKADNTDASFVGQINDTTFGIWDAPDFSWRLAFNHSIGRIGIGTTTPIAPLSFANTSGNKISLWGTNPSSHYGLGIQGSLLQIYADGASSDIAFGYGGSAQGTFTETMRIKGNGRVGIGTSNPQHPLSLNRNGSGTGFVHTNTFNDVALASFVGADAGWLETLTNHPLHFTTNDGQPQMTLTTAGNVGIGTTTPTTKLSVNGTVRISDGTQSVGKVLTSDAQGNASWKGIERPSMEFAIAVNSIVSSSGTPLGLSFTDQNFNKGFTTTTVGNTTRFIVPSDGVYQINASILMAFVGAVTNDCQIRLVVKPVSNNNQVLRAEHYFLPNTSGRKTSETLSKLISLSQGDQFWIEISFQGNNDLAVYGETGSSSSSSTISCVKFSD